MSAPSVAMEETFTRYRITAEQYHRMGETGIIPEDARVELLDGEIVEMSPIGSRHAGCVNRLNRVFLSVGDRAVLSVQNPLVLPGDNEPVPDFMLLVPRPDAYTASHPTAEDVLLLVEVADTTLAFDRGWKGGLYARYGIREYWILDVESGVVEVRRGPEGDLWRETRLLHPGEEVAPEAFPDLRVAVDAMLPPARSVGDSPSPLRPGRVFVSGGPSSAGSKERL